MVKDKNRDDVFYFNCEKKLFINAKDMRPPYSIWWKTKVKDPQ